MQGRSVLDAVEMAYAREVYLHNEAVIQKKQHSLVDAFCNVSQQFQDKVRPTERFVLILYGDLLVVSLKMMHMYLYRINWLMSK